MSLIRFSNRMPRLFDHFFDNDLIDWSNRNFSETNTTLPAVNVKEKENGFEIEMSAPGLKKEDFNVELTNSVLTISCEKKEDEKKFYKLINLDEAVDVDSTKASYKNGILTLELDKKAKRTGKEVKID